MSDQEALRGIADRAHRELDSVHDFFEHSKIVLAVLGHGRLSLAAKNAMTAVNRTLTIVSAIFGPNDHVETGKRPQPTTL